MYLAFNRGHKQTDLIIMDFAKAFDKVPHRRLQRTAARWTCRRWRNTSSVGEMLDELQWPTLEARRDQSSLLFFHKIHCGTMSIDKEEISIAVI